MNDFSPRCLMPAPSSELEMASQSSAASHSANIAIVSMHSRLEGLLYYQTSLLTSTKHNFLRELTPTVTISKRSIKQQEKASQEKGKYPTSHSSGRENTMQHQNLSTWLVTERNKCCSMCVIMQDVKMSSSNTLRKPSSPILSKLEKGTPTIYKHICLTDNQKTTNVQSKHRGFLIIMYLLILVQVSYIDKEVPSTLKFLSCLHINFRSCRSVFMPSGYLAILSQIP